MGSKSSGGLRPRCAICGRWHKKDEWPHSEKQLSFGDITDLEFEKFDRNGLVEE